MRSWEHVEMKIYTFIVIQSINIMHLFLFSEVSVHYAVWHARNTHFFNALNCLVKTNICHHFVVKVAKKMSAIHCVCVSRDDVKL